MMGKCFFNDICEMTTELLGLLHPCINKDATAEEPLDEGSQKGLQE